MIYQKEQQHRSRNRIVLAKKHHHTIIINNVDNGDYECTYTEYEKMIRLLPKNDYVHLFAFFDDLDRNALDFLTNITNSKCPQLHKNTYRLLLCHF